MNTAKKNQKLGEILMQKGLITERQLKEALEAQLISKEYLGAIFIKKNIISEQDLMKALSEQFNIPFVTLKNERIDWGVCAAYYSSLSASRKALPIYQDDNNVIVAIRDPLDTISLSNFEQSIRPKRLRLVLVCESELEEFIQECRRRRKGSLKSLLEGE